MISAIWLILRAPRAMTGIAFFSTTLTFRLFECIPYRNVIPEVV